MRNPNRPLYEKTMIDSPIKIISINVNRTISATENDLQIAVESEVDLILIQEPWFFGDRNREEWASAKSTSHGGYTQILPNFNPAIRPRTLTYVSRTFKPSVSLALDSPMDTDIQVLDISEGRNSMQIINIYN